RAPRDLHSFPTRRSSDLGPIQVNQRPSATAIMPWSVACDPGQLNVIWYGTSFFDGKTTPDNYPASAAWYVFFAQNRNATLAGSRSEEHTSELQLRGHLVC